MTCYRPALDLLVATVRKTERDAGRGLKDQTLDLYKATNQQLEVKAGVDIVTLGQNEESAQDKLKQQEPDWDQAVPFDLMDKLLPVVRRLTYNSLALLGGTYSGSGAPRDFLCSVACWFVQCDEQHYCVFAVCRPELCTVGNSEMGLRSSGHSSTKC